MKLNGSIYQSGLTVKNGRLINHAPDGVTGIRQASDMKKMQKRIDKIDMIAQGYAKGEQICEMNKDIKRSFGL